MNAETQRHRGRNAENAANEATEMANNARLVLNFTTPCCGALVSMNDLNYVWPAAFASFVLEAMNPDVKDLTLVQEQELAACLGCQIRKVWVHI
jgi:hypothetical protein